MILGKHRLVRQQFNYFDSHRDKYTADYHGQWLVFYRFRVHSHHDSFTEAAREAHKHFKPGTFLIQECLAQHEVKPIIVHGHKTYTPVGD